MLLSRCAKLLYCLFYKQIEAVEFGVEVFEVGGVGGHSGRRSPSFSEPIYDRIRIRKFCPIQIGKMPI